MEVRLIISPLSPHSAELKNFRLTKMSRIIRAILKFEFFLYFVLKNFLFKIFEFKIFFFTLIIFKKQFH
jgi:hypothetical protein